MRFMSFFTELKRRNVFRVGIAYLIGSWLLAQIAELILGTFNAPDWTLQFIFVVLLIGFPIALFFAWAFELTPDGVKRESEVDRSQSNQQKTGQKLNRGIIIALVLALAYFVWESRFAETGSDPLSGQTSEQVTSVKENSALTSDDAEPVTDHSVAVLPFVNMSSDPEQEYFSDGITEEVINALVKIPGLSVPARTSVFAFKGQLQDVREIGRELSVAHVLEGSIRSQGQQVRITAQLINVESGFHLWSETYDRQLDNIFAVQEEIALAIAGVLVGELGIGVQSVPNRTVNMQAYDIYLQGRALLRDRDYNAVDVFQKVTKLDPEFAPAWAALAMSYQFKGNFSADISSQELALTTARFALSLDPKNVDALTAMASASRDTWQWLEASEYFEAALAIDPQSAELLEDYAEFLFNVGRWDEYLAVSERGFAIDPLLVPLVDAHVVALSIHGRHQEALDILANLASRGSTFLTLRELTVHLAAGDSGSAITLITDLDPDKVPEEISNAMIGLLENPQDIQSREVLSDLFLQDSIYRRHSLLEAVQTVLAFSGDAEFVINTLFTQFRNSGWGNIETIWLPAMAPVRQHPRFAEFLELVSLPEYWDQSGWPDVCQRANDGRIECQ
jgi:TolB-like protein